MLPPESTQSHTYQNFKTSSLLSIGKLCDYNCSSLFTKKDVTIFNSDKNTVLNRIRNTSYRWWYLTIKSSQPETSLISPTTPNANSVLHKDKTKQELASYLHSDLGCAKTSNFIQTINNENFITWTFINSKLISKHPHIYPPTLKGNLRQEQLNTKSIKKVQQKRNFKQNHFLPRSLRHKTVFKLSKWRNPEQYIQISLKDIRIFRVTATSTL